MSENIVGQISAGSRPVYEVAETDDGQDIVIRHVENPAKMVIVMRSAIPSLVRVLQKVRA